MSRKIPAEGDWSGLLDTARETSLGLQPSDAVPHGSLVSAVRDECDVNQSTASQWIANAVQKGWLEQRGTGADREYVADDEDATLHDTEAISRFLGDDDIKEKDVENALDAAVDYYHSQLNDQRWLIEAKWGIDSKTIDELRIGFAPAKNELPAHLEEQGIDPIAALKAGVVRCGAVKYVYEDNSGDPGDLPAGLEELAAARAAGEISPEEISLEAVLDAVREEHDVRLYAWWDARIVFPYHDETGTVRYLIARKTGQSDDVPGKYLKLANTKPWVADDIVFEPIYGCGTVEPNEDLILTEGITDAIRAHEAGFPCISPVTKQFKKGHYDALLEYAEEVETAFLCFDSEESGVGLDGALRTAWFLQENGVDARVAELPRGDREEKVDLAEFLQENDSNDLRNVLDEAIAPDDHPDFDDVVHGDEEPEPDDTPGGDTSGSSGGGKTGSKQSALFDLDISDVVENDSRNGVKPGYRGDNPIRHVGNSHSDYFVYEQYRGGMRARDFKADHTYTALSWLACAAGARSTSDPSGSFDASEIWAAWKYAKEQDILGETDPIPWQARLHIAREHSLAPRGLIKKASRDPSMLPTTVHNRILETVEEQYGLNPGKDALDTDHKAEKRAEYLAGGDKDDKDQQVKRMLATLDELSD
ncbi:toprim domain-containing protein [Natronoarchaeum rubrum]|uniref:toprim domain-containing protein n=1 Tax=Natronoarchaeum rubrum TaxID=755311 RepID=UPI0021136BA2|nr:toprim domain-containing protein [Natronoarchaeum rubrum]